MGTFYSHELGYTETKLSDSGLHSYPPSVLSFLPLIDLFSNTKLRKSSEKRKTTIAWETVARKESTLDHF